MAADKSKNLLALLKHGLCVGHVEGAAHAPVGGEGLEDGRAVQLSALPEASLDHGPLVLGAGGGADHVEAGQLRVP